MAQFKSENGLNDSKYFTHAVFSTHFNLFLSVFINFYNQRTFLKCTKTQSSVSETQMRWPTLFNLHPNFNMMNHSATLIIRQGVGF